MNDRIILVIMAVLIQAAHPLNAQSDDKGSRASNIMLLYQNQSPKPLNFEIFVGYDTYGALYGINQNTLYKTADKQAFEFRELMLGPISSVDIQNPLTIIVFYQETNTVVFLDNRLNEKRRIDFNHVEAFPAAQWVFNAGSNRLWLMDQNSQSLWVYNTQNNQPVIISQPIIDVLELKCRFNDCLAQTAEEIIQISLYGTLIDRKPISQGVLLDYNDKYQLVARNNTLFDLGSNKTLIFPEIQSENQINGLQLREDFLYIYERKVLRRFALNP